MSVAAPARPPAPFAPLRGVAGYLLGTDHKSVATRIFGTAMAFLVAGGVLALLMRTELAAPGMQVTSRGGYDQMFSMHGSTMIYLVVTPVALALGTYFVPLQVGAAEIAGPRVNLLGFLAYAAGAVIAWLSWLPRNGAGSSGWTAEFPMSDSVNTPGAGMDLWIVGVSLATLGALVLAACQLATIVARRAPGMTLLRMPVFTWAMLATCIMTLASFPSLLLAMGGLMLDRHGVSVYPGAGGAAAYQHLFWFYGHPVVYTMFFPFVGAGLEVIATFSGRRVFGYKGIALSLLAFAALSSAVWGHHMFTTGQVSNLYFSLTSHMLVVPAGMEYVAAAGTLIGGALVLRTPMLFAIGFFVQFLIGGVTGVYVGSPPLDYHVHDSYFVVAHFHYTLFAGSIFGLFAAVYYWWPKVTGIMFHEGLGRVHFWLLVIGTNVTFFPMFLLGYDGMPRRVADYAASAGWTTANLISTIGSYVIALGMLAFALNVVVSWLAGRPAGPDPWGGQTLEWATTSPPPRHNFEGPLPPIRSSEPLMDRRGVPEASR
ncbi:MAG: cytochrome c oxidase subunit [Solirubrobacteraceae bacterium]|jgi:cytochrome c oxidase subunit 1|nr:cytochrome c oxidase subunit [Solirubrobacteraceae bacterium]